MMKNVRVESDEILVSFDVSSLFTCRPIKIAWFFLCEYTIRDGEKFTLPFLVAYFCYESRQLSDTLFLPIIAVPMLKFVHFLKPNIVLLILLRNCENAVSSLSGQQDMCNFSNLARILLSDIFISCISPSLMPIPLSDKFSKGGVGTRLHLSDSFYGMPLCTEKQVRAPKYINPFMP